MSRAALVLLVASLLLPALAEGQSMTLTVTNAGTSTSPTLAEYKAGQMARSFTYTLALAGPAANSTFPSGCTYSGTVRMTPTSADLGNSKSLADVSWSSSLGNSGSSLTQNSFVTLGTQTFTSYTTATQVTVTLTTTLRWTETSTSFSGTGLRFDLLASATGGSNC
jgi:hypothetical protein